MWFRTKVVTLDKRLPWPYIPSVAVRFQHGGIRYSTDTPEEADELLAILRRRDEQDSERRAFTRAERIVNPSLRTEILEHFGTPWTPAILATFVERLGKPQKKALEVMLGQSRTTDEELRSALGVASNQALAGVLSGISKQAAALNISARDVFTVHNFRNGGQRRNAYEAAEKFSEMAAQQNWPSVSNLTLDKRLDST